MFCSSLCASLEWVLNSYSSLKRYCLVGKISYVEGSTFVVTMPSAHEKPDRIFNFETPRGIKRKGKLILETN